MIQQRCLWFTAFGGNRTTGHKRGLFHMCKSTKDAKAQHATTVEGIGLMTEAIDWIGHNIYLFNSSAISVMKSNTSSSEKLELRTTSDDIHQLIYPSGLRVDPINGKCDFDDNKKIVNFGDEHVLGYIFWSSLGGSGLHPHIGRSNMDGRHSTPIVLNEYVMTRKVQMKRINSYFSHSRQLRLH